MTQNEINQNTMLSVGATSIGAQNNLTINGSNVNVNLCMDANLVEQQIRALWEENFPKLQAEAERVTNERMEEMLGAIRDEILNNLGEKISEFSDPGVQYSTYEAMKSYARYGDKNLLALLPEMLTRRINSDDLYLKLVVDQAMEKAKFLTETQIDGLTALFMCKHIKYKNIKTLQDLQDFMSGIELVLGDVKPSAFVMPLSQGCLQLNIGKAHGCFASKYGLPEDEVLKICPNIFKNLPGDYGLSPIGIVLAIVNAKRKLGCEFNMHHFINI